MGDTVALDYNASQVLWLAATNGTLWRSALEKQALGKPDALRLKPPAWKQPVTALATLPLHGLVLFGCDDGGLHLAL